MKLNKIICAFFLPNGDFADDTLRTFEWYRASPARYWYAILQPVSQRINWGYHIEKGQYAEIWLNNPLMGRWEENPGTYTFKQHTNDVGPIPDEQWHLKGRRWFLECDAMVVENKVAENTLEYAWSRVALVVDTADIRRTDTNHVLTQVGKNKWEIFSSEYDIFQYNVHFKQFPAYLWDGNTNEYPADQIPLGEWRHYVVDLTELIRDGYKGWGGFGSELYDKFKILGWGMAVENFGNITTRARIRNVKIYFK